MNEFQSTKYQVEYLPGQGNHIFTYNGYKMWVTIEEQQTLMTGYENKPTKFEVLTITTTGSDPAILRKLVAEALDY